MNSTLTSANPTRRGCEFLAMRTLRQFVGKSLWYRRSNSYARPNQNGPFIPSIQNPLRRPEPIQRCEHRQRPSGPVVEPHLPAPRYLATSWKVELSGLSAQSGFHYRPGAGVPTGGSDFDGDGLVNGQGLALTANFPNTSQPTTRHPALEHGHPYRKRFNIGRTGAGTVLFEFFNLFNHGNLPGRARIGGKRLLRFGSTVQRGSLPAERPRSASF